MALNFHQKAMLIGAVTVALCVGVFLWIVVLDKGTLSVTSNPPYELSVEGSRLKVSKTRTCTADPCTVSLPPGTFTLTVSKSGYFEETSAVTVARGATTPLNVDLTYVPIIGEIHPPENDASLLALAAMPHSSDDFIFVDDETYQKQRLDYTDSETGVVTTWAYFDRPLADPLVFPNMERTQALVVDQANSVNRLYLVDGVAFSRRAAGDVKDVVATKWAPDGNELLIQAEGATGLFHLAVGSLVLTEWPLVSSLDKVTWDTRGHRLFATPYPLSSDALGASTTAFDLIQRVLDGAPPPETQRVFSIGEYDPSTEMYRLLYDVPASLELAYENVKMVYDPAYDRLYFLEGNGVRFFEVVRE